MLVTNGLCVVAGLLVRAISSSPVDNAAARATAAVAVSLVLLMVAALALAVTVLCPELPHPHGGALVRDLIGPLLRFGRR